GHPGLARTLRLLAYPTRDAGDVEGVWAMREEALASAREEGDAREVAWGLFLVGAGRYRRGDPAGGQRMVEEGLAVCPAPGAAFGRLEALAILSRIALGRGQTGRAPAAGAVARPRPGAQAPGGRGHGALAAGERGPGGGRRRGRARPGKPGAGRRPRGRRAVAARPPARGVRRAGRRVGVGDPGRPAVRRRGRPARAVGDPAVGVGAPRVRAGSRG